EGEVVEAERAARRASLEDGRMVLDPLRVLRGGGADAHHHILNRAARALEVHDDPVRDTGVEAKHRDGERVLANPSAALERGERIADADRLGDGAWLRLDAPRHRVHVREAGAA